MSWTYTGRPDEVRLDRIRLLIGDTIQDEPLLTDEEILWIMSREPNDYIVASECARLIAARYARQADISVGELSVKFSQLALRYTALAQELMSQAVSSISSAVETSILAKPPREPLFRIGQFSRSN